MGRAGHCLWGMWTMGAQGSFAFTLTAGDRHFGSSARGPAAAAAAWAWARPGRCLGASWKAGSLGGQELGAAFRRRVLKAEEVLQRKCKKANFSPLKCNFKESYSTLPRTAPLKPQGAACLLLLPLVFQFLSPFTVLGRVQLKGLLEFCVFVTLLPFLKNAPVYGSCLRAQSPESTRELRLQSGALAKGTGPPAPSLPSPPLTGVGVDTNHCGARAMALWLQAGPRGQNLGGQRPLPLQPAQPLPGGGLADSLL